MNTLLAVLALLALSVCLLDLVLTLGVIRRLREHTERISQLSSGWSEPATMLREGERAGPFKAMATTGEILSRDGLSGHTLVGVFSPSCTTCEEKLPAFTAVAETFAGGRDRVIAVVVGPDSDATPYRERLEPVARVVVEPGPGGVSEALAIKGFPAFGLLAEDGRVVASDLLLDEQAVRASAPAVPAAG